MRPRIPAGECGCSGRLQAAVGQTPTGDELGLPRQSRIAPQRPGREPGALNDFGSRQLSAVTVAWHQSRCRYCSKVLANSLLTGTVPFCRPLARRSPPPAAITCAYKDRWLRCPGWRTWSHRSRHLHTATKSELHRPRSEQCLYRLRRAGPARTRALPSGPKVRRDLADPVRRADPLDLADLVRRADPLGLVDPLRRPDPLGLVDPVMRVGRIPRQRAS